MNYVMNNATRTVTNCYNHSKTRAWWKMHEVQSMSYMHWIILTVYRRLKMLIITRAIQVHYSYRHTGNVHNCGYKALEWRKRTVMHAKKCDLSYAQDYKEALPYCVIHQSVRTIDKREERNRMTDWSVINSGSEIYFLAYLPRWMADENIYQPARFFNHPQIIICFLLLQVAVIV